MRTILISLAGAVSALAIATPASAQWAQPAPYGAPAYGYGAPGYGYNAYGTANVQARVAGLRQQLFALQRQRLIRRDEAKRLDREIRAIGDRALRESYAPVNPYEMQQLEQRLGQIQQRLQYAASRGYGYPGYSGSYGYGANGYYGGQNGYYPRDNDRDDDGDYDD